MVVLLVSVRFDGSRFLLLSAYPREFAKEAIENRWIVTDDKPKNRYHRCNRKYGPGSVQRTGFVEMLEPKPATKMK